MKDKKILPPKWAEGFLSWYCREDLLEDLQGDLNEYFYRNVKLKGQRLAQLIYVIDVLKFLRLYTIRKPKSTNSMIGFILFQNHFKTSARNIAKNKAFAAINIVGLAISMCVGLIIIATVIELQSFNTFHENYERIYRVRNTLSAVDFGREEYASTSLMAAKKIKETVAGIDHATILRRGFNKDVQQGDKTIPLKGFWADESFFTVFTFPLASGNTFTALRDINSIVLTETSADKLFGTTDVAGKLVRIDTIDYTVTAVVKDPPLNSYLRFDMLGSFVTIDSKKLTENDKDWMKWDQMWNTYLYITLPANGTIQNVKESLSKISKEGNKTVLNSSIELQLQPFNEMVLSNGLSMEMGPTFNKSILWTIGVFAFIVILSACFNYTNLSIARALKRSREVGIRKVVGATRGHVFNQFIFESILLSVLSLVLSFFLFLLIRPWFISMDNAFQEMITLRPSAEVIFYFIGLAVAVGIFAGFLPALFFSRINTINVLKGVSSIKLFKHINLRKGLIVFQYSLSLLFIISVGIEYKQYQYSLDFDLGFATENILTVDMQKNNAALLEKEFSEIAEVKKISKSNHISSIGASNASAYMKYHSIDSTKLYFNFIDEGYVPLHEHKFIAGNNFTTVSSDQENDKEVIINERTLEWMKLSDPDDAIGEEIDLEGKKMKVIGVIQNFNHDRINHFIQPFAFRANPSQFEMMSLKIESANVLVTMKKIEQAWKKVDHVHPLQAEFYSESIRNAYNKMSWMAKIIGAVAFMAICIASLGLLGMVIFTTETRLKEISLRKVLGATEAHLVLLMSKGFLLLLFVAAVIAIPIAWYIFDQIIFLRFVYRAPIGIVDLFSGAFAVLLLAFIIIGSHTLKVARTNPTEILKME